MIRRVLYACTQDPLDVSNWSGTIHHIYKALAGAFESVEPWLIPIPPRPTYERLQAGLTRRLYRAIDVPDGEVWFAKACGRLIQDRLTEQPVDAVFSHAPRVFGFLPGDTPAFAFTDAVFPNLLNYYPGFDRVRPRTLRASMETERRGIARCQRFFVSSEWARAATMEAYGTPSDHVIVMPLGANLERLDPGSLTVTIRARRDGPCRLLFLGVEWRRKGGDIAVEAARLLNERGIPTELFVVGCDPPPSAAALPYVKPIGFLDKRKAEERKKLIALLDGSRFLIMPSRAEAYGIAVAEAYCRAVPAIAADTGGLGSLVHDGTTGFLVPYDAGGAAYAEAALRVLNDDAAYEAMCSAAYRAAQDEFNWSVVGQRIKAEMEHPLTH